MRVLAACLLAAILALPAAAQKQGEQQASPEMLQGQFPYALTQFGGMNVYKDSAHMGHDESVLAQNVLTEHGYVEKRPGSVLASNFPSTVENMIGYVTQGGTWLMIAHSSNSLYSTDFGTPPVAIATVTVGRSVSFQPAFNTLIAVDGLVEVEYNGTSTGTTVGFPECQYLEFAQQRIFCARIANESTSEVRISSVGGQGYWTVPPDPTIIPNAPNFFYINYADGQPITCMKNTPWGVVVGKQRSLWIIKGYDNTNWYIRNVDPSIGCVDNRTMQMVDGRLQFAAVDGVYSWTGAGPLDLESLPIDPVYQSARQSTAQQEVWTTQQTGDWQAGVLNPSGPGAPMSATMDPGNLIPSSFTFITTSTTDFASGTLSNTSTNTTYGLSLTSAPVVLSWSIPFNSGGYSVWPSSAEVYSANGNFTTAVAAYTQSVGTFTVTMYMANGFGGLGYFFLDSSGVGVAGNPTGSGYFIGHKSGGASCLYKGTFSSPTCLLSLSMSNGTQYSFSVYRDVSGNFSVTQNGSYIGSFTDTTYTTPAYVAVTTGGNGADAKFGITSYYFPSSTGSFTSAAYNTTLSTPTWGNLNVQMSSGALASQGYSTITFQTQTSADGVTWNAPRISTPVVQIPSANQQYIRWIASFTAVSTGPASVLNVPTVQTVTILAATTGYYYSPVHFIGSDISSWGSYDVGIHNAQTSVITGNALTGTSTITYQIREATYAFSATAAAPAWTNQQPNATIGLAISTPTYVQWNGLLNFSNAEIAPIWNLATVNWNTGLPTAPAASAYLLHRYHLCLAISGSSNDTCLVQQRTRDWVEFTGQSIGAFSLFNGTLYGGSGISDGAAWREMQNGVYNDAGVAIDSIWASGDLLFGDPVGQKVVDEIWLDAIPSSSTILDVNYAVDRSTVYVTKAFDLGQSNKAINLRVPMDSRFALGKYFRLMFENAQNAYFRINGATIWGRYKPRTD